MRLVRATTYCFLAPRSFLGYLRVTSRMASTSLSASLDPSLVDADGNLLKVPQPFPTSPLAIAAQTGDLATLRSFPVEEFAESDEHENTPLIWAAEGGHNDAVTFLLEAKADVVNAQGYLGNTALGRACRCGHVDVVASLLGAAAIDPNIPNRKLQYPMHFAAFKRHPEVVKLMLASGLCDLTVTDRKGRTPAEDTKDEKIREMIKAAE